MRKTPKGWLIYIFIFVLLPAFLPEAAAVEGYYIEEEVRTPPPGAGLDLVMIRKSWYANQMMRKDESHLGVTIARFDKDSIYVLDPPSKTYVAISPKYFQDYAEAAMLAYGAEKDSKGDLYFPEDLLVRTESTKQVCLWHCYQVMTNPKYRDEDKPYVVMWYSSEVDFPVAYYGEQLNTFFGNSPLVQGLFDRMRQFEGYPVRVEARRPGGFTITTLLKVEHKNKFDPGLFEIPQDYTQVPGPEESPAPQRKK